MPLFRAFELTLDSDVPMPELPAAAEAAEPDLRLLVESGRGGGTGDEGWTVLSVQGDGTPWVLWRREGAARILRFPGMADFLVEEGGAVVRCRPHAGVPEGTLRHLFLDTVLPCVLDHRGSVVLHGSAVKGPSGCIAFLGESGAGKSTLAAAFSARGFPVVGDDALLLEPDGAEVRVVPAYPGLRLWPDSPALPEATARPREVVAHYSDKVRLELPGAAFAGAREAGPLRRIHLLPPAGGQRAAAVTITPTPLREAFVALLERGFFLDPGDRGRMREDFLRMAESPLLRRVRTLSFPLGGEGLDAVVEAVLRESRE